MPQQLTEYWEYNGSLFTAVVSMTHNQAYKNPFRCCALSYTNVWMWSWTFLGYTSNFSWMLFMVPLMTHIDIPLRSPLVANSLP